jgi:hypothetical protein
VKFIKATKGKLSFQIDRKEKQLFFQVLKLYPLVPANHQELSRAEAKPEDQELLEEALAMQHREHKRRLDAMMKAKSRFRATKAGYRFTLKEEELEWLLQVLNDIRVGSWLLLGSPDGPAETFAALNDNTAPYFWALEVSGHFQMNLLAAATSGRAARAKSPPAPE